MISNLLVAALLQAAASPAPASPEARVQGTASLLCTAETGGRVRDCELVGEAPAGRGFGRAALRATETIRINTPAEGGPKVGSRTEVPVDFELTVEEAASRGITPPGSPPLAEWAQWAGGPPPAAQVAELYPPLAKARGLNGQGRALCIVAPNGRLTQCRALM